MAAPADEAETDDPSGPVKDPARAKTADPLDDERRPRRKMGMRVPSDRVPRPDRSQPDIPIDPQPSGVVAPSAVASAFGKSGPVPSMITAQKAGANGDRPNGDRPPEPRPTGQALDAWAKDGWTPPPGAYPVRPPPSPLAIDPADLIPRIESTRVPAVLPPPPPQVTLKPRLETPAPAAIAASAAATPPPLPPEPHHDENHKTPPTGVPALAAEALAEAERSGKIEATPPPLRLETPAPLPPPPETAIPEAIPVEIISAPQPQAASDDEASRTLEMAAVQPPPEVDVDVDVDDSAVTAAPADELPTTVSEELSDADLVPEEPAAVAASPPPPPAEAVAAAPAAKEEDGVELSGDEIEEVAAPAPGAVATPIVARPPPPAAAAAPAVAPPAPAPATAPAAAQAPSDLNKKKRRGKAWFEEVFDEDYLRTLPYLTPATTQREASFIAESLTAPTGAQLLDLGCGYGRHAMELAARGFQMVGVDLSLPLLIRGADEAQRRGLTINFVHGDMRELTFDETFDGAFSWFTSFGYFDDEANRKVVQGVARALKVGGRFLIEVVNRDYIVAKMPLRVWWEGDGCVVLEEVDFNYYTSRLVSQRSVVFEDARQVEQEISIRAYGLHELGKLLHQCGFRVLEVSGSIAMRGRFFGADSRNLIILAEKRPPPGKDQ